MRILSSVLALFTLAAAQEAPTLPPNPGEPPCDICGAGNEITIPDGIVNVPGQPLISCADLQMVALDGFIPENFCPLLPTVTGVTCGCAPAAPAIAPTDAPVAPPTDAPVAPQPTLQLFPPTLQLFQLMLQ